MQHIPILFCPLFYTGTKTVSFELSFDLITFPGYRCIYPFCLHDKETTQFH